MSNLVTNFAGPMIGVGATEAPIDLDPGTQWDWQYHQAYTQDINEDLQRTKKVVLVVLVGGLTSMALIGLLAFR